MQVSCKGGGKTVARTYWRRSPKSTIPGTLYNRLLPGITREAWSTPARAGVRVHALRIASNLRAPLVILAGLVAVYWKLLLTKQYTFLEDPDGARQVLPWLDVQVNALRHFSWMLWDRYECAGQSLIGQVQPAVLSPFTFLLALFPLSSTGHIQLYWVHVWFVLIHFTAALFAYLLFRDLSCPTPAAVLGAIFYGTAGYIGNTGWPQMLAAAIWAPLVFLFLLRTLRGRTPIRNAAFTGTSLGASWLSGHHGPSICLTLAVFGTALVYVFTRPAFRIEALRRVAVMTAALALVSAAQVLPAIEYGKQSLRWTLEEHAWGDRIPFPEHESLGMKPVDLLHLFLPGGNGIYADPFAGVVAISLIGLAIWCAFQKREVRLFVVLGVCALLYSMPKNDVLYGFFYALVPMVEKAREPVMAFSIFHLCAAVLTAIGASVMLTGIDAHRNRIVIRVLLWFGGITLGLFYLDMYLRPTLTSYVVDGDPRVGVIALIGVLAAAVYRATYLGYLRRTGAVALLAVLIVIEQGNEAPWNWVHKNDTQHATYLKPLFETQDIADFLRKQPKPLRVEWNHEDLEFGFGDWNRIDAVDASGASVPASLHRLGPWNDRVAQLYGVEYTISKASTRPAQREIFSDPAGYKVYVNPDALPRAWTVHRIVNAPNDPAGFDMVNSGSLDLRSTAVMRGNSPHVAACEGDQVQSIDEQQASVRVRVQMVCEGLLVVSDNWYPGWRATVDGRSAPIFLVDQAIRAVAVGPGTHEVVMTYRPVTIYTGLLLLALGVGLTLWLARRAERDGADVLDAATIHSI